MTDLEWRVWSYRTGSVGQLWSLVKKYHGLYRIECKQWGNGKVSIKFIIELKKVTRRRSFNTGKKET